MVRFVMHEIRGWGETLMSGQAAFLAILILSERTEVAAWAQQDPQYEGMCWLYTLVRKLVELTSFQRTWVGGAPYPE